ncbi:peptide ABC transporter substrate-binding protein [Bacteroidia bacterium]|nr:peptide ABC transporter substrate-binding protein [Bacteroidia bacterium]
MIKIPYTKPFLSCQAQIALLKSRGMIFANEAKALHLLENISYHRLSAYWHPLLADKQNHIFKSGANFETIFNLYKFDRELRKLIISELEKIEVAIRSKMTYVMSLSYNAFWMEDTSLFSNMTMYQATLAKIEEELSRTDDDLIVSFKTTYTNPLPPSFMLLEITSFGILLRLYNNFLPRRAKKDIAAIFGLSDSVFASWLHSIVNPNHTFRQKLKELFAKYPTIDVKAMGFPSNWQNEPLWELPSG